MDWPERVERVANLLRTAAVDARLEELPQSTGTAVEAARALGCDPGRIVKSIVFVCGDRFVLALVPGDRRADPARIAHAAEASEARVARAVEVMAATGFEPGAVAPFPLERIERVLVERTLVGPELVWVGAGSDRHLAGLAPADLVRLARAELADLVDH